MENIENGGADNEIYVSEHNQKGVIEQMYASSECGTMNGERQQQFQEVGNEIGSESGVEPDYTEWVFDDKGEDDDILFELTTEQAMATLRYFTRQIQVNPTKPSTADRTNMMTKTHSDDLELISQLLSDKEKDLELAARIGQSLLQRNKELLLKIEKMEDFLSETKENETQLKYDLQHKNQLMRQYIEEDESRSHSSGGSKDDCDDEELKKLTRRCRMLEKENHELFAEALSLREVTEEVEEKEEGLVLDCIEQLASAKLQITSLTDEIAQKFEDNVRQQEEITQLISMVVELQSRQKQLNTENELLQEQLYEANENQETLQEQLAEMTDKFRETLNLLQDNQEEMRLLKTRVRSGSRASSDWSLEVGPNSSSFLQDSLATEIEETVKRDLFSRQSSAENRRYNKKLMDNVRYLNVKQFESLSRSTSGRTSPVSNWSFASDERSDTASTMSYETESTRPKRPVKKLQIVKPLEGSETLNKWHHLASQNVKGGLNITAVDKSPGKLLGSSLEDDHVTVVNDNIITLPDIDIDSSTDEESTTKITKPLPRNLKQSTPDEKQTNSAFASLNTPIHQKRTIITRNSAALTSLRQGRKLLTDKEREGKSSVEVIDMIANAMRKVNVEAKTGQRILMSLAANQRKKHKGDSPSHGYKNMPHVNKALEKVSQNKNGNDQRTNTKYSAETVIPKDQEKVIVQNKTYDNDNVVSDTDYHNLGLASKVEYLHLDVKSQASDDIDNDIDEDLNSVSGPLGLLNRANPSESNDEIMGRLLSFSGQAKDNTLKNENAHQTLRRNKSSGSLVDLVVNKRGIGSLTTKPHLISPLSQPGAISLNTTSNSNEADNTSNIFPPKQTSKSVESGLDNPKPEAEPNNQSGGLYGLFSFFGKLT